MSLFLLTVQKIGPSDGIPTKRAPIPAATDVPTNIISGVMRGCTFTGRSFIRGRTLACHIPSTTIGATATRKTPTYSRRCRKNSFRNEPRTKAKSSRASQGRSWNHAKSARQPTIKSRKVTSAGCVKVVASKGYANDTAAQRSRFPQSLPKE